MNKRELLFKNLRREGMGGVPSDIELTPPKIREFNQGYPDQDLSTYFGCYHKVEHIKFTPSYTSDGSYLFSKHTMPEKFDVDPWGIGKSYGSEAAFHMCHFHSPLQGDETTIEEINCYPLPIISDAEKKRLTARNRQIKELGYASFGDFTQTIWERSWLIRGMNDLMIDMSLEDERAELILTKVTDHACECVAILAESGCNIIALGDDIGMQSSTMMSVPMWEKWIKPNLKRVVDTIKTINPEIFIFYHSCGYITPFIEGLLDAGIEILNPIQPECMDLFEIDRLYGERLSFWGGIGTQTTLPFGTPEDVRARTLELYEHFKDKGGMVICPTHIIEPDVSWENLNAYQDTIQELRKNLTES